MHTHIMTIVHITRHPVSLSHAWKNLVNYFEPDLLETCIVICHIMQFFIFAVISFMSQPSLAPLIHLVIFQS